MKSVVESPIQDWNVGDVRPFVLTIRGASSITGTPVIAIYDKDGNNKSATMLSSTSGTTNGTNTVTTSSVQALEGGETYYLSISATVDGRTDVYHCTIGPVNSAWGS